MKRRMLTLAASTAMMVGMLAGPAMAGEITGNGKSTPIRDHVAASICSFSGLDDPDPDFFDRTQSYGQAVRLGFGAFAPSPGEACNPNTSFEE